MLPAPTFLGSPLGGQVAAGAAEPAELKVVQAGDGTAVGRGGHMVGDRQAEIAKWKPVIQAAGVYAD